MKNVILRWLPAIRNVPPHHAVLGIAGLAIAGLTVAAPGLTRPVPATIAGKPAGVDQLAADYATAAQQGPAASAGEVPKMGVSTAPLASAVAQPPPPFEKALVPDFRLQPNYYYCGPAATRLAITAHGGGSPSMDELAAMLGTTTSGTDSAEDTTRVLNRVLGAGIYRTRSIPGPATAAQMDQLRLDIVHAVSHGYAGVANVVGGAQDLLGGWHEYGGGHYVSIVGYGQGGMTMKIADPADTQGDGSYWVHTADLANWMATRGYSA